MRARIGVAYSYPATNLTVFNALRVCVEHPSLIPVRRIVQSQPRASYTPRRRQSVLWQTSPSWVGFATFKNGSELIAGEGVEVL